VKKPNRGTLIIIGGHEDKDPRSRRDILTEVARHAQRSKGRLVIVTVATQHPKDVGDEYLAIFRELGVDDPTVLDVRSREDAFCESTLAKLDDVSVVFMTGGDQLRLTSQMADSPTWQRLVELYEHGTTIAGTSAGAAAMPETMIVGGANDKSDRLTASGMMSALRMASGLGFIQHVIIDSHFAERGRFGRLLGAVAQNPANIGLGIDENTAVVVEADRGMRVIGSGAVYVFDGSAISYSSLSDRNPEGILSMFNVKLHVLAPGDQYDLNRRQPIVPEIPPEERE